MLSAIACQKICACHKQGTVPLKGNLIPARGQRVEHPQLKLTVPVTCMRVPGRVLPVTSSKRQ